MATDKGLQAVAERYKRREDAAERVRVARTMASFRQDEESANELAAALEEFRKIEREINSQ